MKNVLRFVLVLSAFISSQSFAQSGNWTWINGDSIYNSTGNYGLQGVPSPSNVPPSLYESIEWKDNQGKFWLYGGYGTSSVAYADLWKYDPSTNEWTWMKGPGTTNYAGNFGVQGVTDPANNPPSKYCANSWVDMAGNFWMFAGYNLTGQLYDDLWKFDPITNNWTWIKGNAVISQLPIYGVQGIPDPANTPGSRYESSASWMDNNNNLWFFGGTITATFGLTNDLWKYDISTNQWTFMKGSMVENLQGNYGIKGVASPTNLPGCRQAYSKWKDASGNFWLFGGLGYDADSLRGNMNDLWKYDILSNNWTWINGTDTVDQPGVYGSLHVPSPTNIPPSRLEQRSTFTDACGNFWMFAGISYFTSAPIKFYNDLWKYDLTSGLWTWMSGDSISDQTANWGSKNISSPTNKPGSRSGAVAWYTGDSTVYVFGGFFVGTTTKLLNDLWKFQLDSVCITNPVAPVAQFQISDSVVCSGTCLSLVDASLNNPTFWQWNISGPQAYVFNQQNVSNFCPTQQGVYSVTLVVCNSFSCDTSIVSNAIEVDSLPIVNLGNDTLLCIGSTLQLDAGAGYSSYLWNTTDSTSSITVTDAGSYSVIVQSGICSATDSIIVTTQSCAVVVSQFAASDSNFCQNNCISLNDSSLNNPVSWQWIINGPQQFNFTQQNISNLCLTLAGTYDVTLITCNAFGCDTLAQTSFITVDSIPQINLGNDTLICSGISLLIDAGAGFGSYLWSTSETTNAISVSSAGTFSVIVQSGECVATDTIVVTKQSCNAPLTQFSVSDTSFCEKQCVDFFDLSTNNPISWQWFFPGADSVTSNVQNPTGICYNAYGGFDVTLITCNAFGCDTLVFQNFIHEYINPVDTITQSNDTLYSLPFSSYQWYEVSSGIIPGATNQYYVFTVNGNYFCVAIDSIGCTATSNTISNTALHQYESANEIMLQPNPGNGIFVLSGSYILKQSFELNIIDATGKIVYQEQVNPESSHQLNLSELANGIYSMQLISNSDNHILKLIIEK